MKKAIIMMCLFVCAAGFTAAGGTQEAELEEINVSYVKSPFNLPLIIMKERGMLSAAFEERGIKVNYYEICSGARQAQAMAAGSLDIGGVMNSTSILLARSSRNDVRIVAGFSRPVNVFAIAAGDPDIRDIEDLKGKKVAGPKGTVLHQLLAAALLSEGLCMDEVEFLEMGLPQASTAMMSGQIDAALLAGSLLIKARENGAHIITTAEGFVTPKLVIACRGDFVDTHPEAVDLYLQVYREALAWIESHLEEALEIGAEEQGISMDDAAKLYNWTEFTAVLTEEDIRTMEDDIAFMVENGMLENPVNPKECMCETAF